ncbi:MAG: hypothetical protein JSV86_10690 [Gemmatimonadota bacterium]|nr:MAG: hypothetical protein JSV86_10690 [Gemmatimonadota bacterium]
MPLTIRWVGDSFVLDWSPHGRSLLVQGRDLNDRRGIYQIDVQTGAATPIVQGCCVRWPTWVPDGNVVFVSWEGRGDTVRVVARDLETGNERELQRIPPPAYLSELAASPDGRWLAFFRSSVPAWSQEEGEWTLVTMPLAGGSLRVLARPSVQSRRILNRGFPRLVWDSDSRHLIYAINSVRDGQSAVSLWRVAVDDGQPQILGPAIEGFWLHSLSAHPNGHQVAFIGEYWDEQPPIGAKEDPIDSAEEMWVLEDFLPPLEARR